MALATGRTSPGFLEKSGLTQHRLAGVGRQAQLPWLTPRAEEDPPGAATDQTGIPQDALFDRASGRGSKSAKQTQSPSRRFREGLGWAAQMLTEKSLMKDMTLRAREKNH